MRYHELPTHPDLRPFVQLVWMMASETPADQAAKQRILPDGILELVTHWGIPWATTVAGGEATTQPQSFVLSQMSKYIEIESRGLTGFVSVRFFPWGGHHFFARPVTDFVDDTIRAQDLWPGHGAELIEAVRSATHDTARAQAVQAFLRARLAEHGKPEAQRVDTAIRLIRKSEGRLPIAEICRRAKMSHKQLQRAFVRAAGTTPKTFARITRFLNVCRHLEQFRGTTLTELAHACGYFDQAHFIKDFKNFSGLTPGEFFAKNNVAFADL